MRIRRMIPKNSKIFAPHFIGNFCVLWEPGAVSVTKPDLLATGVVADDFDVTERRMARERSWVDRIKD